MPGTPGRRPGHAWHAGSLAAGGSAAVGGRGTAARGEAATTTARCCGHGTRRAQWLCHCPQPAPSAGPEPVPRPPPHPAPRAVEATGLATALVRLVDRPTRYGHPPPMGVPMGVPDLVAGSPSCRACAGPPGMACPMPGHARAWGLAAWWPAARGLPGLAHERPDGLPGTRAMPWPYVPGWPAGYPPARPTPVVAALRRGPGHGQPGQPGGQARPRGRRCHYGG